jgi:hypothetical protein
VSYRICRTYAVVGVAVPLLGIATAISMGVLTQAWVLVASIPPDQRAALDGTVMTRLAMTTGV